MKCDEFVPGRVENEAKEKNNFLAVMNAIFLEL
jgi:hypothetical protein